MGMPTIPAALAFCLAGYLFGSLTPSIWITRLVKGVDVRDSGSGHATTTNTARQIGFGWGALVMVLDIAKGFIPTWLALTYAPAAWIAPLTAACAVVGHCWPLFAGFRGGMGLATAGGAIMAGNWLGFVLGLGLLILLTLIIRHGARASVAFGILIAPVLYLLGLRGEVIWIAIAIGIVISIRFLIDWNRQYRELWLDREKSQG
jgi:glycerol-3-phosphate acyltransferase PlsY